MPVGIGVVMPWPASALLIATGSVMVLGIRSLPVAVL